VKPIQRLFIFDRREVSILFIMGSMISLFTFTLGVHFGKKVGNRTWVASHNDSAIVHTMNDHVPNRQELAEQTKGVQQALEEVLNQELHDEVTKTGLKLDTPHQMHLPLATRSKNAGAVAHASAESAHDGRKPASVHEHEAPAHPGTKAHAEHPTTEHHPQNHARPLYTLQIGSFSNAEEAKKRIAELETSELKPFLKEAEIHGKGKWYRLYLGGYASREAAQHAGESFQSKHKIESFIVTKTN
jgi:cell division septation protein DedD